MLFITFDYSCLTIFILSKNIYYALDTTVKNLNNLFFLFEIVYFLYYSRQYL